MQLLERLVELIGNDGKSIGQSCLHWLAELIVAFVIQKLTSKKTV